MKDIPCDTTEYKISPNPEMAVINCYQCIEKWRLQWLMEDIQDLLEVKGKSKIQITHDRNEAKSIMKELENRLRNEMVTEEKQRTAADQFFQGIGRGCYWGTKPQYDINSVDARLYGCACCGVKDYHDITLFDKSQNFQLLQLNELNLLKLTKEDVVTYHDQLRVELQLPVNEEGTLDTFYPWKLRSIYEHHNEEHDETEYFHLHPELIVPANKSLGTSPFAILCSECANSIKNGEVPINSVAGGVDFGYSSRFHLETLSVRELHIIAFVRYYYNIIKIKSNTRHVKEHQ